MNSVIKASVNAVAIAAMGAIAVVGSSKLASAEESAPMIGEVRATAIAWDNPQITEQMHRDGWLEARGQLLQTRDFPELYGAIGRRWTGTSVHEDLFALPEIHDVHALLESGSDPVPSGRPRHTRTSSLYY